MSPLPAGGEVRRPISTRHCCVCASTKPGTSEESGASMTRARMRGWRTDPDQRLVRRRDLLARDGDCAVRDRIEVSHSSARARGRTGTRDQLTAVSDDECGGWGGHSGHGGSIARSFSDTSAALVPATLTILSRARSPDAIEISRRACPRERQHRDEGFCGAPSTGPQRATSNASPVSATRVLPAAGRPVEAPPPASRRGSLVRGRSPVLIPHEFERVRA
jgi:hypothetical protein